MLKRAIAAGAATLAQISGAAAHLDRLPHAHLHPASVPFDAGWLAALLAATTIMLGIAFLAARSRLAQHRARQRPR